MILLPRRSPAVDTGSEEPALLRAKTQSTNGEGIFPLQASFDVCTSPEQEWTTTNLLQADVGVKPETSISAQVTAREEFARPPKKWQQPKVTAWSNDYVNQVV